MQFLNVNIGDSFQFDGANPALDHIRYVKKSERSAALHALNAREYDINEAGLLCNVKNVGALFEIGRSIDISGYDGTFYWCSSCSGSVFLEDIINAGYANYHNYAKMLVVSKPDEPVNLVPFVARIDENSFKCDVSDDPFGSPRIVRLVNDEFYFVTPDGLSQIAVPYEGADAIKFFIANEPLYVDAKTLAEHEQDFLAEMRADLYESPHKSEINSMRITANAHSDDYKVSVNFDVTTWFEQATDDELLALNECDYGGTYLADQVARYMFESGNKEVSDLFDYLAIVNRHNRASNNMRFESQINEDQALSWIKANRPDLLESSSTLSMS